MVLRTKGSTWRAEDNLGFLSLGDYASSGEDVTATLTALLALGFPVFIPSGTWLISSFTLPASGILFGAGPESVLKVADAANTINISLSSNSILRKLAVDGNKINQAGVNLHTIQVNGASRVTLEDVHVMNSKSDSFSFIGANSECQLFGCSATGFLGNGIRVEQGSDLSIYDFNAYISDAVATGDGIAIASNGNAVSKISISNPIAKSCVNRGISLLGNGSKNVSEVSIMNPRCEANGTNGIHLINTTGVTMLGGMSIGNGIDGVRLEGDVQFTRVTNMQMKSNVAFGAREVIAGSTPNFNNFLYDISSGNGTDPITVLGGSSTVVG